MGPVLGLLVVLLLLAAHGVFVAGEFETIAGFVLDRLGFIPDAGATSDYDGWDLEVLRMEGRRIARLKLTRQGGDDGGEVSP